MNHRSAFTLLEVVVALVLMGSLLAGSLLAFSKHRQQLAMAAKRIEATMVADQLIAELGAQQGGLPAVARGSVAGKADWIWEISPVGTTTLATVRLRVVRFQILELRPTPKRLIAVDMVQPTESR